MSLSKEYHTLNIVVSTGRSKELLGRVVTVKELNEMTFEELEAYFKIYELNYADKVSNNLNNAIIDLYTFAVNKVVPIDDVEKLRNDLYDSYILNHELKNFTGGISRISGKLWSLVEITLTTVKHLKIGQEQCKEIYEEQCKVVDSSLVMNIDSSL
jgi:hypothetical protein